MRNNLASKNLNWLLAVGGIIGWFSSFTLTIDKIKLLEDPSYISSCNINSIIACGNIVKTAQASVFDFPNSVIGVSSFPILVLVGVLGLLNYSIPRWMYQVIAVVSGLATVFVTWLFYQSVYVIGNLCPYCIVVWGMTIPIFFLTLRDLIKVSKNKNIKYLEPFTGFLTLAWFLIVASAIFVEFFI